jgi:hypothetical protein
MKNNHSSIHPLDMLPACFTITVLYQCLNTVSLYFFVVFSIAGDMGSCLGLYVSCKRIILYVNIRIFRMILRGIHLFILILAAAACGRHVCSYLNYSLNDMRTGSSSSGRSAHPSVMGSYRDVDDNEHYTVDLFVSYLGPLHRSTFAPSSTP